MSPNVTSDTDGNSLLALVEAPPPSGERVLDDGRSVRLWVGQWKHLMVRGAQDELNATEYLRELIERDEQAYREFQGSAR